MSIDCDFQLVITEDMTELIIEAPTTAFLEIEAVGLPGRDGADGPALVPMAFGSKGGQYVEVGTAEFTIEYPATALGIRAKLVEAPEGSNFGIALRKNGTIIKHVAIPEFGTDSGYQLIPDDVAHFDAGDYMTLDRTQVGSTVPGTNLTITVWLRMDI